MIVTPIQAFYLLRNGIDLEYLDEDTWFPLFKDSPIRLLWEHNIRIKKIKVNKSRNHLKKV